MRFTQPSLGLVCALSMLALPMSTTAAEIRDFQTAIVRIRQGKPINCEGAYDRLQWNAAGDLSGADALED